MTVTEHFDRMDELIRLIPAYDMRIAAYKDALGCTAPQCDSEQVTCSRSTDAMGCKVAALIDAERERDSLWTELNERTSIAMEWIGLLTNPQEITLLTERYILRAANRDIAAKRSLSLRRVQMVIKTAKEKLSRRLDQKSFA